MKKFTQRILSFCVLVLIALFNLKVQAQNFMISTSQMCYSASGNTATAKITSPVSGAASYSWNATTTGPSTACPVTYTNIVTSGDSVKFTFSCCGIYTVTCSAYNSSSSLITTLTNTYSVTCPPNITINSSPSSVSLCLGTSMTLTAFGGMSYTWTPFAITGATAVVPVLSSPTCYTVTAQTISGCTGTATSCHSPLMPPNMTIAGPSFGTVCAGSSANFTASGAVSYTWNTTPPIVSPTINVMPTNYWNMYTVTAIGTTGCVGIMTVSLFQDSTCAFVWPGDANSDGVVNNSDVLEIGLAFSATGAVRSPGGNAYTAQFVNTWTGVGSTGKNRCHVDCNGSGNVDNADTVAIYNNYMLTHSFRNSENSSTNPDISLVSSQTSVNEGVWNKVDIVLGSSGNPLNQLYGLAFDINYDKTLIQTNSAYIAYTPSFLNASNQNVQFRKTDFGNGKIYAASVRVDGNNVSGNGKIGEFWFKVKSGLPANSVLNISVSNSKRIDYNGVSTGMATNGTAAFNVTSGVGLKENALQNSLYLFPNPTSNILTIQSEIKAPVNYTLLDIIGREVMKGEFTGYKTIDVSVLDKGTYLVQINSAHETCYKKLVIEK
jgi:hypothetical protein